MSDFNPQLFGKICNTLFMLGVPAHVSGYEYLVSAITRVVNDPSNLRAITSRLYPGVARECNSEPQRVERSIRNAIEMGFSRCDISMLEDYFGAAFDREKGKTTNSEFIATVAQKIRLELGHVPETAEANK